MSSFDPNADFFAAPRPPHAPSAPPAPGHGFGAPPRPPAPAPSSPPPVPRTPVPTWAKVLIAVGCVVLLLPVLGVVGAVAIPVFLNQRGKAAEAQVKQDVRSVAMAEENYAVANGTYTTDPLALGVAEPESEVVILAADTAGYCLGGRDADGEGDPWYYSSTGGLSRTPCA
jgi:type IV pilus assembly protein PilA